jgi:hypothetical protein
LCEGEQENKEHNLSELDIADGGGIEEEKQSDIDEEGNEEEQLVSSQDMKHSVIVDAPQD